MEDHNEEPRAPADVGGGGGGRRLASPSPACTARMHGRSACLRRPPFDLAAALKIVNHDFDRHSEANRGFAGVVHVAKVYGPEVPQVLWKARCGWWFGRKACKDGKAWRILEVDEDLAPFGVCGRCAAP